jgi:hypothetical protein
MREEGDINRRKGQEKECAARMEHGIVKCLRVPACVSVFTLICLCLVVEYSVEEQRCKM